MSTNTTVPTVKSVITELVNGATRDKSGFDLLDRSGMARVRSGLNARLIESVRFGKNDGSAVIAALDAVKPGSTEAPKVVTESDVRAAMGEMAAKLRFALNAVLAGNVTVDGYDGDIPVLSDNEDETDIPEMTDKMVESAEKLTTFAFGRKTKENDIPDMIHEVFEQVEIGTFLKVSDIRKRIAANHPEKNVSATWDGRLNAALFPRDAETGAYGASRVEGVEAVRPGHSSYTDRNGGIKVESDVWGESTNTDETA